MTLYAPNEAIKKEMERLYPGVRVELTQKLPLDEPRYRPRDRRTKLKGE